MPSLFGVSHVAVQFPLYEAFKSYVKEQRRSNSNLLSSEEDPDDLPASIILACSSSAKMIASVMTYPHEVLRTRMQMQPRLVESGSGNGNGSGISGGNGNRSFSTLAKSSHQSLSHDLRNPSRSFNYNPSSSIRSSTPLISSSHWLPFRRRFSISKFRLNQNSNPASSSIHNQNSISTQSSPKGTYSGIFRTCKTIATEEGIRGFYRGMGVNLIRTVPSSALTILT